MTVGASAVLVLIGAGTATVAAMTADRPRIVQAVRQDQPVATAPAPGTTPQAATAPSAAERLGTQAGEPAERLAEQADRSGTRTPRKEPARRPAQAAPTSPAVAQPATPPAEPVVTTRTESERRAIPFRTRLMRDPALPRGRQRVQAEGVPGEEILRYVVTLTDGRPTQRRLIGSAVTRQPQDRVVAFGTRRGGWDCPPDRRCRPGRPA